MFVKLTQEDDKKFFVNSEAIIAIKPVDGNATGSTLILKGYEAGINVKETPDKVTDYLRTLR